MLSLILRVHGLFCRHHFLAKVLILCDVEIPLSKSSIQHIQFCGNFWLKGCTLCALMV